MKQKKLRVSETSKILADEIRRELDKVRNEEMRKEAIKKWESFGGFLNGLDMSDENKENIRILYENQCNTLINEGMTKEDAESFDIIPLPLIRHVSNQMDEQLKDKDGDK